ncbi:MAG: sugar nucleotide-binding protein, partial [Candidatus Cybelea sp.]
MKRVLLIGGSGQLGTQVRRRWADCEIVAPSHDELALEETVNLRAALGDVRPDVLLNAAAFADVDRCEREPERAFAANAIAVGAAAEAAHECGALFVTISTDYVFDGSTTLPYD